MECPLRRSLCFLAALLLPLSACVQSDGSPALGATDSQQVFSFTLAGPGSKGGHCTVDGARGAVSSGTNLLGSPTVSIRGNIRHGTIICTDALGATYATTVNQSVPQGLRTPAASAWLKAGQPAANVELDIGSGIMRVFAMALVRIR
jgi:hypothetical protein